MEAKVSADQSFVVASHMEICGNRMCEPGTWESLPWKDCVGSKWIPKALELRRWWILWPKSWNIYCGTSLVVVVLHVSETSRSKALSTELSALRYTALGGMFIYLLDGSPYESAEMDDRGCQIWIHGNSIRKRTNISNAHASENVIVSGNMSAWKCFGQSWYGVGKSIGVGEGGR